MCHYKVVVALIGVAPVIVVALTKGYSGSGYRAYLHIREEYHC